MSLSDNDTEIENKPGDRCNNARWDLNPKGGQCPNIATVWRKWQRSGDTARGETSRVDVYYAVCDACAELIQESAQEEIWEAKIS